MNKKGSLAIVESGFEFAQSSDEYDGLSILNIIDPYIKSQKVLSKYGFSDWIN